MALAKTLETEMFVPESQQAHAYTYCLFKLINYVTVYYFTIILKTV